MTTDQWKEFLERYAAALIATEEEPEGDWRSFPPATPEAVAATEKRLGVTLPPSLKAFYAVSNGWPYDVGSYGFLHPLPVEEIGWFRDVFPDSGVLKGYYGSYSDAQVQQSLVVTTEGERAACWILDPQTVTPHGEWAACRPEVAEGLREWEPDGFAALFQREAEAAIEDAFGK